MKVTAYKDPLTGVLFEDKTALDKFQANRKREEAAAQLRAQARAEAEQARLTLVRELGSREQFSTLVRSMYEHALNSLRLKRKKDALQVLDVRIKRWAISGSLRLIIDVEVELSGNPSSTYADTFVSLAPHGVLYPFRLHGSGGASITREGAYRYCCAISTELKYLPKLYAKVRDLTQLFLAEEEYERRLESEVELVQDQDQDLAELRRIATNAAQEAEAAQRVHLDALRNQNQREKDLAAEVSAKMPFAQQAELDKLNAETGLVPGPGFRDRWFAMELRNAILSDSVV